MHVRNIANRLLYGSLSRPDHLRIFSCIFNYLLIYCSYMRARSTKGIQSGLLCTIIVTILGYHYIPTAAGVSTLWSFAYGYMASRTHVDHIMFWLACISIVIPWSLDSTIRKDYDRELWPWQQSYPFIATAAHFLFSIFGALFGYISRCK